MIYFFADILVAPYSRLIKDADTMAPMKLVEYLAVGKPIIASDLPTIRTALGQFDKIGAAFFAPDSQTAFISALGGILKRAAEFASWGEKMRVSAAGMSWDAKASVLLDWLKTLKP